MTLNSDAHASAGSLLFASDLHLAGDAPLRTEAWLRLARLCATSQTVEGLYLLGDVFDLWLGDDDDRPPHAEVEASMQALVEAGTPVFVQRGNHDLLLDRDFERRTGVPVLEDETCIDDQGERLLLMHGDLLCTGDTEYLAFRASAHDAERQAQFLSMPLEQRVAFAADLRQRSRSHTQQSAADIMDVTEAACRDALERNAADVLIHGHTHRPADHRVETARGVRTRHVLSDWHRPPEVLMRRNGSFERLQLDALEARLIAAR